MPAAAMEDAQEGTVEVEWMVEKRWKSWRRISPVLASRHAVWPRPPPPSVLDQDALLPLMLTGTRETASPMLLIGDVDLKEACSGVLSHPGTKFGVEIEDRDLDATGAQGTPRGGPCPKRRHRQRR